jgi:hypothetical protein
MPAAASERLAAARAAVDQVCQLLLSPTPEQMDQCAGLLQTAVGELTGFRNSAAAATNPQLKTEALTHARSLASSLGQAKRLFESAAAFYENWIRCLAGMCAGYTPHGQPAALDRGARFLARG